MPLVTVGLFVAVAILLVSNIYIDMQNEDFFKLGYMFKYLTGYSPRYSSSFTPTGNYYYGKQTTFHPNGYAGYVQSEGSRWVPSMTRTVNVGGISRKELQEKYPAPYHSVFITD